MRRMQSTAEALGCSEAVALESRARRWQCKSNFSCKLGG